MRSAWEAIHRLLKRGPPPPPVYQGQFDPKGVWAALKVFLGLDDIRERHTTFRQRTARSAMSDTAPSDPRAAPWKVPAPPTP